jgi:hypothetical protein
MSSALHCWFVCLAVNVNVDQDASYLSFFYGIADYVLNHLFCSASIDVAACVIPLVDGRGSHIDHPCCFCLLFLWHKLVFRSSIVSVEPLEDFLLFSDYFVYVFSKFFKKDCFPLVKTLIKFFRFSLSTICVELLFDHVHRNSLQNTILHASPTFAYPVQAYFAWRERTENIVITERTALNARTFYYPRSIISSNPWLRLF